MIFSIQLLINKSWLERQVSNLKNHFSRKQEYTDKSKLTSLLYV